MEFTSKLKDPQTPSTPTTEPWVGLPMVRPDPNSPYPTTFVTADTSSFKQVVQMLTGSSHNQPPPPKKHGFNLYERRNYNKTILSPLTQSLNTQTNQNASFSPREILSPSLLDFPALTLSPVTPLTNHDDPFEKSSPSVGGGGSSMEEEEIRAIAEKGFYLHPSPLSTPREYEPQLLPLFPLSSPRASQP